MHDRIEINFLDWIVVFVICTSIISILSLAINIFNVHRTIILATFLTISLFFFKRRSFENNFKFQKSEHLIPVMFLIIASLFFRSEPYLYTAGGQDEGVYVNMSKYFENYGKIFIIDDLRKSLPENLQKVYDSANLRVEKRKNIRIEHEKEGVYLLGVYLKDQQKSEYVFQFYHLHSLWMAIFGKLFGDDHRIYSLVFFGILSVVAFYFLAFEFSSNRLTACMAGGLLAVNPLHTFFSKFPCTEVVALSFTTLSFYYLLKYYNLSKKGVYPLSYLVVSSLLMLCMFFVRISGFMYIPFFYALLILVSLYVTDKVVRKQISIYILFIFLFYILSVWYGLRFSFPYSTDIYRTSFEKIFGVHWKYYILLLIIFMVTYYLSLLKGNNRAYVNMTRKIVLRFRKIVPCLFLIVFILGAYKVYQLGFTDTYTGNRWIDLRWHAAARQWQSILYWSVIVVFEYLSPFVFILFAFGIFTSIRKNNGPEILLTLFVLCFFTYISLLQWFIPYQYYYARYLLSEALPFILLLTLINLYYFGRFKKIAYSFVLCAAIYMTFFTVFQFKGKELDGFQRSLSVLNNYISQDDILIFDKNIKTMRAEIKTPLKFYFDYNVLTAKNSDRKMYLDYFCGKHRNVYFLDSVSNSNFTNMMKTIHIYSDIFEHTNHIPLHRVRLSKNFFLSQNVCSNFFSQKTQKELSGYTKTILGGHLVNFENDKIWTKGLSKITNLDVDIGSNKYLVLTTNGWHPWLHNKKKLNLRLKANGKFLKFVKQIQHKYYFSLPPGLPRITDLSIYCNTFVPKELGINSDKRKLGIDVKSIKLVQKIDT